MNFFSLKNLSVFADYSFHITSSNANEGIKAILDFFIQKKFFIRSHETSFCWYIWRYYYWCGGTSLPYCSFVAFSALAWLRLCGFGAFGAFGVCKIFS